MALSKGIGIINAVEIILAIDDSGLPGPALESFYLENMLGPAGLDNPPIIVESVSHPKLVSGLEYWLIVAPPDGVGVNWHTNWGTIPEKRAIRLVSTGPWAVYSTDISSQVGAYRIEGTAINPIPEPSTLLMILCVAPFVARRLRR